MLLSEKGRHWLSVTYSKLIVEQSQLDPSQLDISIVDPDGSPRNITNTITGGKPGGF